MSIEGLWSALASGSHVYASDLPLVFESFGSLSPECILPFGIAFFNSTGSFVVPLRLVSGVGISFLIGFCIWRECFGFVGLLLGFSPVDASGWLGGSSFSGSVLLIGVWPVSMEFAGYDVVFESTSWSRRFLNRVSSPLQILTIGVFSLPAPFPASPFFAPLLVLDVIFYLELIPKALIFGWVNLM
ncbi:hypothetical protein ISN44_As08g035940 [Arabidopsis suecica]|uniref:Uncharacterized protein n=1 Tax=Arabidopsis suecica TaxID=45249 RepID=A0A8T2BAE9_ARASU|nr:hypothetical protein ISN44_As08g035940 [Arabidopsis suecica]